jgi:hypothetical protein
LGELGLTKIQFHSEAIKNFNERANNLLLLFTQRIPAPRKSSLPNTGIISQDISDKVINRLVGGEIDYSGRDISIFFKLGEKEIGLFNGNFISLVKLAEDMQKGGEIYSMVSVKYIYKIIFEWMCLRYTGKMQDEAINYFVSKCEQDIQSYEVWIPIAHTIIDGEFQVGAIKFTNLSKEIFDTWEAESIIKAPNESRKVTSEKFYEKERKRKQGFAVAVVKVEGEKKRAEEIAYEQVEQALGLLSIFSPAAYFINHVSYSTICGKSFVDQVECYFIKGGQISIHNQSVLNIQPIDWVMRKEFVDSLKQHGLSMINELLLIKDKNQFQEKILNSISLFARSTLMKSIPDKLVYIFASLESMLLRDEAEPILQNLADRIAFAITPNGKDRLSIVKNIKEAYKFRSKFVHHGLGISEIDVLNIFLHNTIGFYFSLLANINIFKTKDDFINALEKRKYGA